MYSVSQNDIIIAERDRKEKMMDKRANKKTGEELQQYLAFRRRGFKVPPKKGKGSYNRKKLKNF
ncbi:MAG: hypothetical protein II631_01655 [Treponema sp.]|nr:hypothetical protein [Treponema sp.]